MSKECILSILLKNGSITPRKVSFPLGFSAFGGSTQPTKNSISQAGERCLFIGYSAVKKRLSEAIPSFDIRHSIFFGSAVRCLNLCSFLMIKLAVFLASGSAYMKLH
jgi:hypothetical protein